MTNTTTQTQTATFADAIDDIVEKRIRWEQGTYAAANAELYSILGDCLDLFIALKRRMDVSKEVNALLDLRGITYNTATSLELKLVRLVFASANTASRIENRLFSYARVIRVAADAKQTGATLAQFIAERHGIDEIRRVNKDGVTSADKQKAQVELARTKLLTPSDSELFTNFDLPDPLQPKAGEQFSLALVRKNADGTGSIVFGTDNVAAVTAVLALAGKALQEHAVKTAEAETAKEVAAVKQRNMAELEAVMAETLGAKQPQFVPQLTISAPVAEPELV
ncbi:hypothetical protein LSUCC0031_02205 [Rhodobacterales bacterium LSUCC0031]|nr:hypothetical protein [Rhodobacterales bacterium LSUCC0031]